MPAATVSSTIEPRHPRGGLSAEDLDKVPQSAARLYLVHRRESNSLQRQRGAGLLVLLKVSLPFNWIRCALFFTMLGAFIFAIFILKDLFSLASITLPMFYCFLVLAGFAIIVFVLFSLLIDKLLSKQIDRLETKIK